MARLVHIVCCALLLCLLCITFVSCSSSVLTQEQLAAEQGLDVNAAWTAFKNKHKKQYKNQKEHDSKFATFKANHAKIQRLNQAHYSKHRRFVYSSTNKFADVDPRVLQRMNGAKGTILSSANRRARFQQLRAKASTELEQIPSIPQYNMPSIPSIPQYSLPSIPSIPSMPSYTPVPTPKIPTYNTPSYNKPGGGSSAHVVNIPDTSIPGFNPSEVTTGAVAANIRPSNGASLPTSVDYTNIITSVKTQGNCGACWAFVAVETLESAIMMKGRRVDDLSVQQLVDCDGSGQNGCRGGSYWTAFDTYMKTKSLNTDSDYPYYEVSWDPSDAERTCSVSATSTPKVASYGFAIPYCPANSKCTKQNEGDMLLALQKYGPLAVIIDSSNLHFYGGGIVGGSDCNSAQGQQNHAVQVVGYGQQDGTAYWVIRNSWGSDWGENGFVRLQFGTNTCGLANLAMYVTV